MQSPRYWQIADSAIHIAIQQQRNSAERFSAMKSGARTLGGNGSIFSS
jgi:hypothetical protein